VRELRQIIDRGPDTPRHLQRQIRIVEGDIFALLNQIADGFAQPANL